jgi:glycine betaine/choline ABC-type transport system substrate-binding protein
MTTSKSKPLKTAKQKTTPKDDTQGINYDVLMEVHKNTRESGFSWVSMAAVKENYQMRSQTLMELINKYGIPVIYNSSQMHPLVSLPALEHVLENATVLHSTSADDTAQNRLEVLKSEAEEQVREKLRNELEAKFQS